MVRRRLLALLLLKSTEFRCTLFSLESFGLLLFPEILCVLFFPLDIQLDKCSVLLLVFGDAGLRLGDIDVVDEVESWRQRWNGRASSQEIAY